MRKVAVIGAGGINSWFIKHLKDVVDLFDKTELIFVKVFDKDEVEEKNLLRENQNFLVEDLMKQKAEVLGKRYGFDYENIFITEENVDLLKNFDDIIVGVDNHKTRQLLYKFALENSKYLLDLRAQGTQISFVVVGREKTENQKTMEYYDNKYFSNPAVMELKGSCQLTADVENDNIQTGNKVIAFMGTWGIYLNHLRDQTVSTSDWRFVY